MRKICLTTLGIFIAYFAGFAQSEYDSTQYKSKDLKIEEANIVSSYYTQNGNNSAVTGGIGTEKLTDISNVIDLKLVKYDYRNRKNNYDLELGVDHYTSASSDMIDLKANSSASHADTRIYPSFNWTRENENKGTTVGGGLAYSHEFDYTSWSGNLNLALKTKNRNGEFAVRVQGFLDQVKLVLPTELIVVNTTTSASSSNGESKYPTAARNSIDAALSYSQIINKNFQIMLLGDIVSQSGYLSLPFHRVYFANGIVHQESLPSNRLKLPIGFRANYFLGDNIILRAYYRYYTDSWGLTAHTFNFEVPIKFTPFFSLSPFYRHNIQNGINYFGAYKTHTAADLYYTSNYDLSTFNSDFYGAGVRIAPPKGVLGIKNINMLELRYGHYTKNIGMQSNIVTLNLKFK